MYSFFTIKLKYTNDQPTRQQSRKISVLVNKKTLERKLSNMNERHLYLIV